MDKQSDQETLKEITSVTSTIIHFIRLKSPGEHDYANDLGEWVNKFIQKIQAKDSGKWKIQLTLFEAHGCLALDGPREGQLVQAYTVRVTAIPAAVTREEAAKRCEEDFMFFECDEHDILGTHEALQPNQIH